MYTSRSRIKHLQYSADGERHGYIAVQRDSCILRYKSKTLQELLLLDIVKAARQEREVFKLPWGSRPLLEGEGNCLIAALGSITCEVVIEIFFGV